MRPIVLHPMPGGVQQVFDRYPDAARPGLLSLRALIFETAAEMPEIGLLTEALKWGQPAYLTPETGAATTLRLGIPKSGGYALYAHCQSRVIPDARALFGDLFPYDGNRAILFDTHDRPDAAALGVVIASALRYHLTAKV